MDLNHAPSILALDDAAFRAAGLSRAKERTLLAIASAVITPTPDPFTMFLLAGPLVLLYFAAVGVCLLIDRRRVQRGEEPDWSDLPDDQASPLT